MLDKDKIKELLTLEDHYQLLKEWGGEPEQTDLGLVSYTICHNPPSQSNGRKLYFYKNSNLYHCYSGCENPSFDVFELVIKVMKIQKGLDFSLVSAMKWICKRFNIPCEDDTNSFSPALADWDYFNLHKKQKEKERTKFELIPLSTVNATILDRFNYKVKIQPWLKENISQEVIEKAKIGFYVGNNQITIPHYDLYGNLIGIRGRSVVEEDCERYGKYRPIFANTIQYNHPLGLNLYGLNWNKEKIKFFGKAIVYEAEKSVLKMSSYLGWGNDISVATCGSNLSSYQVRLLQICGAREIILAYDKQFTDIHSDEAKAWARKLTQIYNKFKNDINISIIWDKYGLLGYKDSPIDAGFDNFKYLYNNRLTAI